MARTQNTPEHRNLLAVYGLLFLGLASMFYMLAMIAKRSETYADRSQDGLAIAVNDGAVMLALTLSLMLTSASMLICVGYARLRWRANRIERIRA